MKSAAGVEREETGEAGRWSTTSRAALYCVAFRSVLLFSSLLLLGLLIQVKSILAFLDAPLTRARARACLSGLPFMVRYLKAGRQRSRRAPASSGPALLIILVSSLSRESVLEFFVT